MTRTEYLNQLEAYLMKLPQSDRIEAMDYFKELFDDAGPEGEEDLMASLGTPKEAAHDVLTTLLDKKINEENPNKNNRQVLQIALLALLAAPIGIPVGIGLLMTIIGIFIAAVSILLAFFAVSAAGMVLGAVLLFESFYVLAESTSAFVLIFGGGLLAIGASSLVLLATSYVTRFFGLLVLRLIQWILNRGKRGEREVKDMRKWTKGFLIFGVVASIIGFSMMIIGIQTDGVRSLLALSQNPVFESRMEELVFDQDIENLNISLTEHSLVITESNDDKIHIQYHPTISEKENLQHSIKEKSLEITDTKSTTRRSIGSSIEGILFIASGISSRNDEVVLSLPRGKDLKNLTAQVNHRILSIANAKLSNAKILSNGYLLRITDSEIKNSQLITTGIVNVFETSLTDSRIQADHEHISAEDIQVHGRVELESKKDMVIKLAKKELERINVELSSDHGSIYHRSREGYNPNEENKEDEEFSNPYKSEKKDTQDLLVAKAGQDINLPKEDVRSPSYRHHE